MVGSCTFQERWLNDERFKYWLKKHSSDKHKAVCKLCNNRLFNTKNWCIYHYLPHESQESPESKKCYKSITVIIFQTQGAR